MTDRKGDAGVALLNVLVVVAISAGIVQSMLGVQDRAIARAQVAADRTQAQALARGGIASLRVALRRDLDFGPEADHLREPWALIAQDETRFEFGSFSVSVDDAQSRFDINSLGPGALAEARVFDRLLAALDLPGALASQISDVVASRGPLPSLDALKEAGIAKPHLDTLATHISALPVPGAININTASEPVLAALFANAAAARSLAVRREAQGYLTRGDLAAIGLVQPTLGGWRSDTFDVTVTATVGDVTHSLERRILRNPLSGQVVDMPIR